MILDDYPRYYVVDGVLYGPRGVPIKGSPGTYGHLTVTLHQDGKHKSFWLHRILCEHFHGPCPDGLECCHGELGNQVNTRENLRWDTHKNNMDDRSEFGSPAKGETHGNAKLTDEKVREARRRLALKEPHRSIAKSLGVHRCQIGRLDRGEIWTHVM